MTHKCLTRFVVFVFAAATWLTGATQGAIISVNFLGSNGNALASNDIVGVGAFAAGNWNNVSGQNSSTSIALIDSTGAASDVTITQFSSKGVFGPGSLTTPQGKLFGSGITVDWGNAVVSLTGLDAFSQYTIVAYFTMYSSFPTDRTASFYTTNSGMTKYYVRGISTASTNWTQGTSTFAADDTPANHTMSNYVVFSGLSGTTDTITMDWGNNNAGFAGFQIIGITVPEPAGIALICMGGLVLIRRK